MASDAFDQDAFDLIVVGAGVFGLSTALEAGRRGRRTLCVDRGAVPNPIAASYGPSRKIRSTYLDPHYTRLALEAMAEWRRLEAETAKELYVAAGNLNVSDSAADAHLDTLEANARAAARKSAGSTPTPSSASFPSSAAAAALCWRRRPASSAPPTASS